MKNLARWAFAVAVLSSAGCSRFCSKKTTTPSPETDGTSAQANRPVVTPNYNGITVNHVVKREVAPGQGKDAIQGSVVKVMYTEWVYDPAALANQGPKISETKEGPFEITIGEGKVIRGFEDGLKGMRKGGKRQLIIPADEAYGEAGKPPKVPPKAMVMIDLEVVDVK
jgi:FKBP-type peptidyl-prolyl cis-trans isomerase FkpA